MIEQVKCDECKQDLDAGVEKEKKEKERLEELLKNQVTCPKCKNEFQISEGQK